MAVLKKDIDENQKKSEINAMDASRKSKLTSIDKLLKETLKGLQMEENYKVYPLIQQWSSIMGQSISQKSLPEYIQGNTLFVRVENSVWMQELEMQKKGLLKKISKIKLDPPIENIRFRLKQSTD